jgi:hypothetical protein
VRPDRAQKIIGSAQTACAESRSIRLASWILRPSTTTTFFLKLYEQGISMKRFIMPVAAVLGILAVTSSAMAQKSITYVPPTLGGFDKPVLPKDPPKKPVGYQGGGVASVVSCSKVCGSPTGLYNVCRNNLTGAIVSKTLLDINACMH